MHFKMVQQRMDNVCKANPNLPSEVQTSWELPDRSEYPPSFLSLQVASFWLAVVSEMVFIVEQLLNNIGTKLI